MIVFRRIITVFLLPILLFYEVHWMSPKDPIIPFSLVFVVALFITAFGGACLGNSLPKKNLTIGSFVLLEFLVVFFAYLHSLFYPLSSTSFYLTIPLPLLLFLYSYAFTKENQPRLFPLFTFFMVVVFSFVFLLNRQEGIEELLRADSGSYTILYFIPFMLCLKNKFIRTFALFLCFVAVVMSFKRGGIICLFSGLYIYAVTGVMQGSDWGKKIKRLFLASIPLFFVVMGIVFVNDFFDDFIFFRFSEIGEGGGSGRDKIYAHTINMIMESSWKELCVGHGWNAVLRDSVLGYSAHNDFLECLYDYGLITFMAYILLYINLIKLALKMLKNNSFYAPPLVASIVMFLSNSLISHILLYEWHFMTFALFWGYIIACEERERYLQKMSIMVDENKHL